MHNINHSLLSPWQRGIRWSTSLYTYIAHTTNICLTVTLYEINKKKSKSNIVSKEMFGKDQSSVKLFPSNSRFVLWQKIRRFKNLSFSIWLTILSNRKYQPVVKGSKTTFTLFQVHRRMAQKIRSTGMFTWNRKSPCKYLLWVRNIALLAFITRIYLAERQIVLICNDLLRLSWDRGLKHVPGHFTCVTSRKLTSPEGAFLTPEI